MRLLLAQFVFMLIIVLTGCDKQNWKSLEIEGVEAPVISLNGTWKFSMNPPKNYHKQNIDFQRWPEIRVPGECQMQGFAIKHDTPYVYKHRFEIPADYGDNQILLNFYGVYSYARVWVNGEYIREHYGGFTKWACDISDVARVGESNTLTVEITDRMDDISYGSGYAKHQIGGILRDVELVALPPQNFEQLYFETDLDDEYNNATLNTYYELSRNTPVNLKFELFDAENRLVKEFRKEEAQQSGKLSVEIEAPLKWDAEHPNLYTIVSSIEKEGQTTLQKKEQIGFREVQVDGNKLLVNGKPVKLRGACRHDVHPTLGRMTTDEYDKMDVMLAKEANMNFIRTSHYPPSEAFLRYCDEYGIYVEDETAVCFVNTYRREGYNQVDSTQNDPEYTHWYLSQVKEMVNHHRNHPSVIMWSIGNESRYGSNFQMCYDWIKANETTRPVIFSYPGLEPEGVEVYDILSMHYPKWYGDKEDYGGAKVEGFSNASMPVLFDEWAHVPAYNRETLKRDPNVRNFWGQSLDSMWNILFEADGGLGGAIWGMIDETFMLPDTLPGYGDWWAEQDYFEGPCVGYGEWGIIDTWRRKKPEFWNTKKAYSPTKIRVKQINLFTPDEPLTLPVHNRFDHTNFNELDIVWKYEGQSGKITDFELAPHEKGNLTVPANNWETGKNLNVKFISKDTFLIDEYNLIIGEREIELPVLQKGKLIVQDAVDVIQVRNGKNNISFDKKTGLIKEIKSGNETLIKSGPYLNLLLTNVTSKGNGSTEIKNYAENWKCTGFSYDITDGICKVSTRGVYGDIKVNFIIQTDKTGTIAIDYFIDNIPLNKRVQELGVKFFTGDAFTILSWDRNAYFTAYPENHLGNPQEEVDLDYKPTMTYREYPDHEWAFDTKNFHYFGLDTTLVLNNVSRSMKENIYSYSLKSANGEGLTVLADGKSACRYDKADDEFILFINELWDYTGIGWGNYSKNISTEKIHNGTITMVLK